MDAFRYCPRCRAPLDAGADPPRCPDCGFVHWRDPKLATGTLVADDGRLLLVRRNHEPGLGLWSFPSGYVDRGEVVEAAAIREAHEEASVEVRLDGLLGVFSEPGNPVVFVVYLASVVAGDPAPGPEALDVGWFAPGALPPLAFEHDRAIIEQWQARADGEERP